MTRLCIFWPIIFMIMTMALTVRSSTSKTWDWASLVTATESELSKAESNTTLSSTENADNGSRGYDACDDNYTMRPLSERTCDSGWFCINGVCLTEGNSSTCECDPGATGIQCQDRCCKECLNGECIVSHTKEEMCNCYLNYSGSFCEIWDPPEIYMVPEAATWYLWVAGACAFVLFLLICLMVILPFCLWRHRAILVMKVVHYFQEYEDDDDRPWDVFISYKSTAIDAYFVEEILFPKLENELGFKSHIHFRDFVAGKTILNNIVSAVQGSRRTIMVISPSYIASELTKFEYQVAQQEMLKRNHRIIPILLEDISECKERMDPALKMILQSVTYIEWPKIESQKKLDNFGRESNSRCRKRRTNVTKATHNQFSNGTPPQFLSSDICNNTESKL